MKRIFLIIWEKNIQNSSIFRTRSILTTLAYLEPEAYSEHCQTSAMECFVKIANLRTFRPQPSKIFPKKTCSEKVFYIFSKKSRFNFQERELFLYF